MKLSWLTRVLLGATATGAVAASTVSTGPAQAASTASGIPGEAAVFSRFSDLAEPETEARYAELLKDSSTKEAVARVNALLESGASAKEIEGTLVPLVAKLTESEADTTLAALMLDYYYGYLQAGLDDGSLQPSDVFDEMLAKDQVLTTAAYGASYVRKRAVRR